MSAHPELPEGTVTFLFSDIEGSSALWEHHPESMKVALARHDRALRLAIVGHRGHVVKTTGDGCHAVFAGAADAVAAALAAQQELLRPLRSSETSEVSPITLHVRMGLHTGEAELRDGDYYGPAVNRAARIMSIGHGGQVLLSAATTALLSDRLPGGASLRDLGEHRLKDLSRPERISQLVAPGLPADFPPLRSLDAYPGNLPVQLTGFIGRERELAEVKRLLAGTRLLTLTGPGGTGKTRLSLQTAGDVQAGFAHGAWLVELAPLADPANVPIAAAAVFDLAPQPGAPPEAVLIDYLRGKHLLLILDNCEHLVEASARLAASLLPACPRLTMLASSREGLGVAGETTYHVPTLTLPDPDETTAAAVCRADAADLFLQRARAARPDFAVTDANAAAVAQIVRRLDGIPLAIELAAARVRSLSPEQIAARLDDRFRLLTGGSRTALPRQQTLRALIDWSYTLLAPAEATLFRRLGVFVGGWTLEAAEEVASDDGDSGRPTNDESRIERVDVLDLLDGLVNKSLVMADEEAGSTRYRFLETIRQYARDKLFESGEGEAIRDRHYAWITARLIDLNILSVNGSERWFGGLSAREYEEFWYLLDHEQDNIRAALEWGIGRADGLADLETLTLAGAHYTVMLVVSGQQPEGEHWISATLDALGDGPPAGGDPLLWKWLRARALMARGHLLVGMGATERALAEAEAGLALARESGNQNILVGSLFQVAFIASMMRDPRAGAAAEELRDLAGRQGVAWAESAAVSYLAGAAFLRGDMARGRALADEAERIANDGRIDMSDVNILFNWGMLLIMKGSLDQGIVTLRQALEKVNRGRMPQFAARVESELAHALRRAGRPDEALPVYRSAIHQWAKLGRRPAVANQLECFAFMARAEGQLERAARLLGAAEVQRAEGGAAMAPWEREEYDRDLAALRETLPADVLAAEWAAGRKLDMDAAVDYAVTG